MALHGLERVSYDIEKRINHREPESYCERARHLECLCTKILGGFFHPMRYSNHIRWVNLTSGCKCSATSSIHDTACSLYDVAINPSSERVPQLYGSTTWTH